MLTTQDLREWVTKIDRSGTFVAIDDGGLCLVEVFEDGTETGTYLELGGLPSRDEWELDARHLGKVRRRDANQTDGG